jgi:flagellar hook assembly protein FlgD
MEYALPTQTSVEILIFDVSGRCVKTLVTERAETGIRSIVWNGTDEKERAVSNGVYFVRFKAGDYTGTRKLVLFK